MTMDTQRLSETQPAFDGNDAVLVATLGSSRELLHRIYSLEVKGVSSSISRRDFHRSHFLDNQKVILVLPLTFIVEMLQVSIRGPIIIHHTGNLYPDNPASGAHD